MSLAIGVLLRAPDDTAAVMAADIARRARHAEDLGLDSVFVGDHLVSADPTLDCVVALTSAAAATQRIRIGFSVMALPLRPVPWVAKQVATLQLVSTGRVILGVGAGANAHGAAAWEALGLPFAERGRRTDDALAVLGDLITGRTENGLAISPGSEVPPIWIGGMSTAAMRRSVRYGDAWFPSMLSAPQVAAGARQLAAIAHDAGATMPHIVLGGGVSSDATPSQTEGFVRALADGYGVPAEHASRVPITGSPQQMAARLSAYAELGVRHMAIGVFAGDWYHQCEQLAEARSLAQT